MSNVFDIKDIEKHSELKKKINSALDNLTPEEIEHYLLPHFPKQAFSRIYNVKCILRDRKGFEKRMKIQNFQPIIKIPIIPPLSVMVSDLKQVPEEQQMISNELTFMFDHWEDNLATNLKDIAIYKEQV